MKASCAAYSQRLSAAHEVHTFARDLADVLERVTGHRAHIEGDKQLDAAAAPIRDALHECDAADLQAVEALISRHNRLASTLAALLKNIEVSYSLQFLNIF